MLSIEISVPPIHSNTLGARISQGDTEWLCLLYSASSGSARDDTIAIRLEARAWIIGEELSGTQILWVNNAYI